jgi:hypothetical protein
VSKVSRELGKPTRWRMNRSPSRFRGTCRTLPDSLANCAARRGSSLSAGAAHFAPLNPSEIKDSECAMKLRPKFSRSIKKMRKKFMQIRHGSVPRSLGVWAGVGRRSGDCRGREAANRSFSKKCPARCLMFEGNSESPAAREWTAESTAVAVSGTPGRTTSQSLLRDEGVGCQPLSPISDTPRTLKLNKSIFQRNN